MMEITQALERIDQEVRACTLEMVPLEICVGRILGKDVIARYNLPNFDNSAMDGYAVKVSMQGCTIPVMGTIFAGDKDELHLSQEACVKIMTGAPVPKGCEAIVPQEEVSQSQGMVTLPPSIKMHQHVRFCGEDIAIGTCLIATGTKLAGYHVALLASQGYSHVQVFRQPVVAVFATGEELKMHFEPLQAHQIYNSNTPTFLARAKELGAVVRFIGSAKDDLEDIKAHIAASLDADLIVTSGGVSVGDADYTKEAFAAFGLETLFDKINIKPGKPTTLGRIGTTWVLNLPGNPLAALLNFELFGHKLLLKLSGNKASHLGIITARAAEAFRIKPGRVTVIPGFWDGSTFAPAPQYSPGMISPLQTSNAMIVLDAHISEVSKGETLKVLSMHAPFSGVEKVSIITS